jgi:hypothetical protein
MNMVEIWFTILTNRAIRRESFDSAAQITRAIKAFLARRNEGTKPSVWTKTGEQYWQRLPDSENYLRDWTSALYTESSIAREANDTS